MVKLAAVHHLSACTAAAQRTRMLAVPRGTDAKTPNSRFVLSQEVILASREKDVTILHLIIDSLACGKTCRKGPGGDHRLSYAMLVRKQAVVASHPVCIVTIYNVLLLLFLRTYFKKIRIYALRNLNILKKTKQKLLVLLLKGLGFFSLTFILL